MTCTYVTMEGEKSKKSRCPEVSAYQRIGSLYFHITVFLEWCVYCIFWYLSSTAFNCHLKTDMGSQRGAAGCGFWPVKDILYFQFLSFFIFFIWHHRRRAFKEGPLGCDLNQSEVRSGETRPIGSRHPVFRHRYICVSDLILGQCFAWFRFQEVRLGHAHKALNPVKAKKKF